MSRYKLEWPFKVAFPPQAMTNVLAETLSKHGVKQCHIAGEKEAVFFLKCSDSFVLKKPRSMPM